MLYKTYIRPIMEYNVSIWAPQSISDIKLAESIQKTFTRKLCKKLNIKYESYADRLTILQIESLEYRRVKFDLILLYKILNNIVHANNENLFLFSNIQNSYNLRRHSLHLLKPPLVKTSTRTNFFSHRIINIWNNLPDSIVTSPSLIIFKQRLNLFSLCNIHNFIFK